jgi:hypothetical protein
VPQPRPDTLALRFLVWNKAALPEDGLVICFGPGIGRAPVGVGRLGPDGPLLPFAATVGSGLPGGTPPRASGAEGLGRGEESREDGSGLRCRSLSFFLPCSFDKSSVVTVSWSEESFDSIFGRFSPSFLTSTSDFRLSGFASSMSLAEGARSVFDLSELDWVFTATESLGSFFTFFLGGTGSSFLMNS